jgi:hypothetical protein
MKLKENLVLREVAGTWVVLPLAEKVLDFNGMLSLNETGVILWKLLETGSTREEMATALTEEYEVGFDQALSDVDEYLEVLKRAGCIE